MITIRDLLRQDQLVVDLVSTVQERLLLVTVFVFVSLQVLQLVVHVTQQLVQLTVVRETGWRFDDLLNRLRHGAIIIGPDLIRIHNRKSSQLTQLLAVHVVDGLKLAEHLGLLQPVLLSEALPVVLVLTHKITGQVLIVLVSHRISEVNIFFVLALVREELGSLEAEVLLDLGLRGRRLVQHLFMLLLRVRELLFALLEEICLLALAAGRGASTSDEEFR